VCFLVAESVLNSMNHILAMRPIRNLAFSGIIAISGCAAQTSAVVSTQPKADTAISVEDTCKGRRNKLQDCLIEGVTRECVKKTDDQTGFMACISERLATGISTTEQKDMSVVVGVGDEVFSVRYGNSLLFHVARMEASAITDKGAEFKFSVERIPLPSIKEKAQLEQEPLTFTFENDPMNAKLLKQAGVFDITVKTAGTGKVRVSFNTDNPTILVLQQ
jgi:hypothetical protein